MEALYLLMGIVEVAGCKPEASKCKERTCIRMQLTQGKTELRDGKRVKPWI